MDDHREVAGKLEAHPSAPLPAWSERPRDHFLTPHEIATLRADFPPPGAGNPTGLSPGLPRLGRHQPEATLRDRRRQ